MIHDTNLRRWADKNAEPRNRVTRRVDDLDRMWALLRDAAKTSQRFTGPPRTRYPSKSAWPDAPDEATWREIMAAYLQGGVIDKMPETENTPAQQSAHDISRADAVLDLFHQYALTGRGYTQRKRRQMLSAIHDAAKGHRVSRVRREYGLSLWAWNENKRKALEDMCRAIGWGA